MVLTVAGSDPSGGAGLQADLKTFHAHGVYGASVVTLLTVQNTVGVRAVEGVAPPFVRAQLDAVLDDLDVAVAKTGALGSAAVIEAVAARWAEGAPPLVVDPVMVSKHGAPLVDEAAVAAMVTRLLPHALVVTPNLAEAARLVGFAVNTRDAMARAAAQIAALGPRHVVIKGGHLAAEACDLVWSAGAVTVFEGPRIDTPHTHGTGCSLSAAIAARLARREPVVEAIRDARRWVREAIATAPGLGHGRGPINHGAEVV
ncbi:MAG: bifunctional hydroxymethylpyrimidine kinase/phosphomethylpyrimidine kinase [Myxococcales bacterium]|nr:bifunctional hydroxymethylpyrimidine kinase/phosphomethylpyrimidine kinase [Myxococcales bacterium]